MLVEQTCHVYSSDSTQSKRDDSVSDTLVEKTDKKACFGGLIACSDKEENTCSAPGDDGDDSTDSTVPKRAAPQCDRPALWYNCDYFGDQFIPNHNPNIPGSHVLFKGICSNIRDYLQTHNGPGIGNNWMNLDYLPGDSSNNRAEACTKSGPSSTAACAEKKRSLWSLAAQNAFNTNGGDIYYSTGWSDSLSCDEFPCKRLFQAWSHTC